MTKLKNLLCVCVALMSWFGCVEQPDLSNVVVLATPKSDTTLHSYDKMRYQLRLFTINEYVEGLSVSSFDIERGKVMCLDTTFAVKQKEVEYDFIYAAPSISKEELDVELSFVVKDDLGNISSIKRNVRVVGQQQMITEKNGIVLYAHTAYLPHCLSLDDVSQPFIAQYASDSLKADIWLDPSDTLSAITWKSQTGVKFVRHNNFNYTTATAEGLQATYQSSKHNDAISNVAINDIIIVGREERVDGVFFVDNIIYDENIQCECIQLSFKGVN